MTEFSNEATDSASDSPPTAAKGESSAPANAGAPADSGAMANSWDGILANLRGRYPGQKDSVLFCLYKLQQNPELRLVDFRDEAKLHGIPMAGRALHSAKVLMGLAQASVRRPKVVAEEAAPAPGSTASPRSEITPGRIRRQRGSSPTDGGSIETKVLDAVRQIQSAAGEEADRLKDAVRQAVAILQKALDE